MGVGRDGEKAESDAPVQGGMHVWAQRVPTNKHRRSLKALLPSFAKVWGGGQSCQETPLPGKVPPPEAPVQTSVVANDWLFIYLTGTSLTCSHEIPLFYLGEVK